LVFGIVLRFYHRTSPISMEQLLQGQQCFQVDAGDRTQAGPAAGRYLEHPGGHLQGRPSNVDATDQHKDSTAPAGAPDGQFNTVAGMPRIENPAKIQLMGVVRFSCSTTNDLTKPWR
jgi:hypothetical protein